MINRVVTAETSNPKESLDNLPFSAPWTAFQVFCAYRAILSVSLIVLFSFKPETSLLGSHSPVLFQKSGLAYMLLTGGALLTCFTYRKGYFIQIQAAVAVDIVLIILLMNASGGNQSGLGVLIAVSTSAAAILTGNAFALAYSVLASIGVLAEELNAGSASKQNPNGLTQVGILAVTYMATSLLSFYLSRKIIHSESVAQASMRGLADMERLNEEIIQFMNTGVLVVDSVNRILLINRAAWVNLGMPQSSKSQRLEQLSTPLARQLNLWRQKNNYRSKPFRNNISGPELSPSFSAIGDQKENVIIFLDDTSTLNQQAQSLKLASLGRLTASIAHEIRNPLGALSHAAQLMKESDNIGADNLGLVDIIQKNTLRVNSIIENIMSLSQRKNVQAKEINLSKYLPAMVQEYSSGKEIKPLLDIQLQNANLKIHFDVSQLSQILTNLIDNAARYSELRTGKPFVQIMVGVEENSHTTFLDVIDKGEGIPPKIAEKIFEPFFTTSRAGTGLGLYLSKELCEANRARLDYIPLTAGGSCFRISFSPANIRNA